MTSTYNTSFKDYNNPTIISLASRISRKYAMKSGSTSTDCWMIGYNPELLTMIWNGYDDNREVEVSDGAKAKEIWVNTVEGYLQGSDANWYDTPSNVVGVPLNAITGEQNPPKDKMFIFYFLIGSDNIVDVVAKKDNNLQE